MKKTHQMLIAGAIALAMASPVYAQGNDTDDSTQITQQQAIEYCQVMADLARTSMTARQHGLPMGKVMKIMNKGVKPDSNMYKINALTVQVAYSKPRWYSKSAIQEAIDDYGNSTFLQCYEGMVTPGE